MKEGLRRLAVVIDIISVLVLGLVAFGFLKGGDTVVLVVIGLFGLLGLALSWVLKGFAKET